MPTMDLTLNEWHDRFSHQTSWTAGLRDFAFKRLNLASADSILEVGCGTGALLGDLATRCTGQIVGLDIEETYLHFAKEKTADSLLVCSDGSNLPFPDNSFDLTCCHYLLLWVKDPTQILKEMARVTCSGSAVIVLAEPDYGGRIDHPIEFVSLGHSQMTSLADQGGNPLMGRELASLFAGSGLVNVNIGVIGSHWDHGYDEIAFSSEWKVLRSDLKYKMSIEMLDKLERLDREQTIAGSRIMFVPTFYAWGMKA